MASEQRGFLRLYQDIMRSQTKNGRIYTLSPTGPIAPSGRQRCRIPGVTRYRQVAGAIGILQDQVEIGATPTKGRTMQGKQEHSLINSPHQRPRGTNTRT